MQTTLAPWTGDPFTMPGTGPTTASDADPVATPEPRQAVTTPTGRTRHWSFSIGRNGLTIVSTVEDHRPRIVAPVRDRHSAAAITVSAVAGGLALLLVGASTGRAWSPSPTARHEDAAMIVPLAKPVSTPLAPTRSKSAVRSAPLPQAVTPASAEDTPPALGRAQAIARALGTGEFQEWAAPDGTTGFAVAGPAEATPQGNCRALAVLTRAIDGSDSVASSRECRVAPAASQP